MAATDETQTDDDGTDFSVAVSMRGRAAHLEVKGAVTNGGHVTLEQLLDRLPAADVTEVVVDLTAVDDVDEAREVVSRAATKDLSLEVTFAHPLSVDRR